MPRCHLCFVLYDPALSRWRPVPEGILVETCRDRALGADVVVDQGRTDADGRVALRVGREGPVHVRVRGGGRTVPLGAGAWTLPERWDSREHRDRAGRPGLLRPRRARSLGTADAPRTFSLSRDWFLRFVLWDPSGHRFRGVPAGLSVAVVHDRALGRDRVLVEGVTDGEGGVHLRLPAELPERPALSVTARVPRGTPRHLDPEAWAWTRRQPGVVAVPREWHSTAATALERPVQDGLWDGVLGDSLGAPREPLAFVLGEDQPRVRPGNAVSLLVDGPETLARMEALIRGARHTVHLQMMLWFDDEVGRRITALLVERARAGVVVRVLLDRDTTEGTHALTALHGVWLRALRTVEEPRRSRLLARNARDVEAERARGDLSGIVRRMRQTENLQLRLTSFPRVVVGRPTEGPLPAAYTALAEARPWFGIARVDHRKLLVVDGRAAVLGGMNIGREYLHETPFDPEKTAEQEPVHKWHDAMVELRGPVVRDLQHLFRERWLEEGGPGFALGSRSGGLGEDPDHPTFPALDPVPEGARVRVVTTTPGARHHVRHTLRALMARAERRLVALTPYLSGDEAIGGLVAAAERGVRTVLVLPDDHNDSVDFLYAARMRYGELLEAGVEVYEYQGRMTHTKVLLSDDDVMIGSVNLNRTSLTRHYELAAVIKDAGVAAEVQRRLVDVDLARSRRIRRRDLDGLLDLNAAGKAYVRGIVGRFF